MTQKERVESIVRDSEKTLLERGVLGMDYKPIRLGPVIVEVIRAVVASVCGGAE